MRVYIFCIYMYISVLILTRTKTIDDYRILTANDLSLYLIIFNRARTHQETISDGNRSIITVFSNIILSKVFLQIAKK